MRARDHGNLSRRPAVVRSSLDSGAGVEAVRLKSRSVLSIPCKRV